MEIHDMDINTKHIKKYAVCLRGSGSGYFGESGSGFLFAPRESNSVYIFTVLHVVIHTLTRIGNNLIVDGDDCHFECRGTEIEYCTLYQELEEEYLAQRTEKEIKEIVRKIDREVSSSQNQERNKDVAVLRIPKSKFKNDDVFGREFYCIEEEELSDDFSFIGFGYPGGKDFMLELKGESRKWNKRDQLRDCQAMGMGQDFVDQMKGFSGTGLVTEYQGRLIFSGLVVSCDSFEKHQCFRAVGTSEIILKMKEKGWEIPDVFGNGAPPEDFLDRVSYFQEDLKYMELSVRRDLKRTFAEIERENKPTDLAKAEAFYDIPKCTGERIACPIYWKGRFWILYIYRAIRDLMGSNDSVNINGQELKIEYICTEGNGKAEISTVVASAIRRNILGHQIKGNCILVWQSEENPDRRIFHKKKFKNIVESIAEGNMGGTDGKPEKAGYDLLSGEMRTKNYGIFHIKYLLEKLEECHTMEEADKKVREILRDVWE